MTVKNLVLSHPAIFGVHPADLSDADYLNIVASCRSRGSSIQQMAFYIADGFAACTKLFALGLNVSAVELSKHIVSLASDYHRYSVVAELSKRLQRHFYKYEDLQTARLYEEKYERSQKADALEYEAQKLYLEVIYNYKHGLRVDKNKVLTSMRLINNRLPVDSCEYHYYFYQCRSILADKTEFPKVCAEAVAYFENLYFNHSAYILIFKCKLVSFYLEAGELELAKLQLNTVFEIVQPNSARWLDAMYLKIQLLRKSSKADKALRAYKKVAQSEIFKELPADHITEWHQLGGELSTEAKAAKQSAT